MRCERVTEIWDRVGGPEAGVLRLLQPDGRRMGRIQRLVIS